METLRRITVSVASGEGPTSQRYRHYPDCARGATACCGIADVCSHPSSARQGSLHAHAG